MTRLLRVNTFTEVGALVAAQHLGFLEDECLAVEVELARSSTTQVEGLLAGRWDLLHTNADNVMKFRARGAEIVVFLVLDTGVSQKLVARPGTSGWEGLRGATLGVDAVDSGFAFVAYELLRVHGLEQGDYEVVSLGATPQRLEGLRSGAVSAALLSHEHEISAREEGMVVLGDAGDHFAHHPGITGATTSGRAAEDPGSLAGYYRALLRADDWVADPAHRDEAVVLVARHRRIDTSRASRLLEMERAGRTASVRSLDDARASLERTADLRHRWTGHQPVGYLDERTMHQVLATYRGHGR